MAFTVSVSPDYIQPVYNDLTFRVYDSANYTKSLYKYNFYTYIGTTLVNTTKLYPRPDGYCNFNPAPILQQYLSRYYNPTLAAYSEGKTQEVLKYKVVFKYEYETSGTTTEYSGNAGVDKYVWNGVAQWTDAKDISTFVAKYVPTSTTSLVLNYIYTGTSYTDGIYLYDNDKRNITFMRKGATGSNNVSSIKITTDTNKVYNYNLPAISNAILSHLSHFPLGLTELNALSWTTTVIPGGLSSNITITEDKGFAVQFYSLASGSLVEVYKPLYFTLKTACKYDHYTIAYQTSLGGYGYINFNKKHFSDITTSKVIYDKVLPYNYGERDRVTSVYGNLIQEVITLNTDWITKQEIVDEIRDMVYSPELWLIDKNGISIPVFIEKSNFSYHSIAQDGMVSYTFTFTEAFKKNTTI